MTYRTLLKNIHPRKYQDDIYNVCKKDNTLVVLPTGLGKTLILLMAAIDRMTQFPKGKILFLAPTKPLCAQQLEYFQKNLPKNYAHFELFTGKTKASIRKDLWKTANMIFSTPQTIMNDLANDLYNLKDVSLLIEDEAHHCLKNYAYTTVATKYKEQALNQRIIGATASVGVKKDIIKQVMENLNIQKIEIRTRESDDVKEYLQEMTFKKIYVDLSPRFKDIKDLLKSLIDARVIELRAMGLLLGMPIKSVVLDELKKVSAMIKKDPKAGHLYRAMSVLGIIIRCAHALELLETQSLHTLNDFIDETYKGKTKGMQTLSRSNEFIKVTEITKDLLAKGQEHEKMDKLKDIILEQQKINSNFKALVFTNYRTTAAAASDCLNKNGISCATFVGQAKKVTTHGSTGYSQIQQKQIVQDFKDGKTKVLTCTSIGEEGLDLPEVNAAIFYEPVPSAIRSIQRRGRIARLMKGSLYILVARDTIDEIYYNVAVKKEEKMNKSLNTISDDINNESDPFKKFEKKMKIEEELDSKNSHNDSKWTKI
jgi:Fanconi anemia group M protein